MKLDSLHEDLKRISDEFPLQQLWEDFTALLQNSVLDSIHELGVAFSDLNFEMDEAISILGNLVRRILDSLPQLFMTAGLNALIGGNVPLGLTLLGLSGVSALGSGIVAGLDARESTVETFAKGGAFTNSIIDTPTRFAYARGGIFGEAGPEAIMPLTRTQDGTLGVRATGDNQTNVTVNVINQSGAEIEQRERNTSTGKEIEIIVKNVVKKAVNSGGLDSSMRSRYGLLPKGAR
jgi:hypothetical protein